MAKGLVIPSIFTAVDKFSGPVSKMSKNTDAAFARMDRKLRKVGDTAFRVGRKSAGIGLAIAAPLGLLANEAVKFEEKMSNVSTLVDTTNESMDKMGDEVLSLSKKLPVPIDELTSSLYDIRSAGIAAENAMSTLEASSKLASGGLGSVEEATNITTSAINAFKSEGMSAAMITDILFKTVKAGKTNISELSQAFGATAPIVQSAGVRLDDFMAATAALTTLGTPAAQAQNQVRASITALQKPSADMEKVFKKLGVTTDKELIQKFGGLVGGFKAVNGAIEELGLNQAKTFRSTEALAAVTSLTGSTNEAYIDTLASMRDGTNELDKAFEKQMKTGKASMQIAKNNMQALGITLGKALIPLINDLVKAVTPMIERFASWVKNNKGTVATILKVAAVIAGLSFAISGISFVVGIASKAMMVFNAVMSANPIFLIITGVALLGVALYKLSGAFSNVSAAEKVQNDVRQRALENTIDQRVEVAILFKTLRRAEEGSKAYTGALAKLEKIQPGITKQYDLQKKSLDALNKAEDYAIGNIIKRAEAEAERQLLQEQTTERLRAQMEGPGFFEAATSLVFGGGAPSAVGEDFANKLKSMKEREDILAERIAKREIESISTEQTKQEITQKQIQQSKEKVEVVIKNETGNNVSVSGTSGANWFMPGLGNTSNL